MTITRPIRLLLARGLVAALAMGGAGCVAYPSPPAQPAFDTDVGPIFLAHCARCHGEGPDGGAQNAAGVPGMTYNAAGAGPPPQPIGPYLTRFFDVCSPLPDGSRGTCQNSADNCTCGAFTWASLIKLRVDGAPNMPIMPPPPAPLLNEWELKVVDAWTKNPICSNSANPDPAICPGP